MLKLLLACGLLAVASAANVCESDENVNVSKFNGGVTEVKIGCKYDAVRRQSCGHYRINLTPGLRVTRDADGNPLYVIEKVTIGVNNTNNNKKVKLRSTFGMIRQYQQDKAKTKGNEDYPFKEREGNWELIGQFFDKTRFDRDSEEVMLESKDNLFKITFKLSDGRSNLDSYANFDCHDQHFEPKEADSQICSWEKASSENYGSYILKHIFDESTVQQGDCECKKIQKVIKKNCGQKTSKSKDRQDRRAAKGKQRKAHTDYADLATQSCAALVYDDTFLRCALETGIVPRAAFRACTEVVCKNDLIACDQLRIVLNNCNSFTAPPPMDLTEMIEEMCVEQESWPPGEGVASFVTEE